jgi:hypothetical protein
LSYLQWLLPSQVNYGQPNCTPDLTFKRQRLFKIAHFFCENQNFSQRKIPQSNYD